MTEPVPPVGVIDTLIGLPADPDQLYAALRRQLLRDEGSRELRMPAGYMFRDVPELHDADDGDPPDPVAVTLAEMDRHGVAVGLLSLGVVPEAAARAVSEHPDRFVPSLTVDPTAGVAARRRLAEMHDRFDLRAVSFFPHGCSPQVAIDDATAYPLYAACCELGLPLFVTVGIAGPRVPSAVQDVERLDRVAHDFPDLVIVMRHGAEPQEELAVRLMRRWPNLHYSTSAFSPRRYPDAIVRFANDDGADRVMYGGYFPMGLSMDRIFAELPEVPFADHVWPAFLHDNAARVLGLDAAA